MVALAAAGAVTVGVTGIAGAGSGGSCGPGIPAFKCDPGGTVAGPGNRPRAVPAPAPYWPSAEAIACGPGFFPSAVVARLTTRFGSLRCFRFGGSDRWIVVGDGM